MVPSYEVYSDSVIAVALFAEDVESDQKNLLYLGVRWLLPAPYRRKNGEMVEVTNIMGGETEWFLLPYTLGTAIGLRLVEQKVAGLSGFDKKGFKRMVSWLVDMEELDDAMCY